MGKGSTCPLNELSSSSNSRFDENTRFEEGWPPFISNSNINTNVEGEIAAGAADTEIETTITAQNLTGSTSGPGESNLIICVQKSVDEYASKTFKVKSHGSGFGA